MAANVKTCEEPMNREREARTVYPWFREKHGEPNHLKSPKAKGKKDSEAGETVKTPPLPSQPSNSTLPVGLLLYSQASNQRGLGLMHLLQSRRGGRNEFCKKQGIHVHEGA